MIRHLRDNYTDREQLAARVRLLVGRSYKRAADRQWMRDQGFDVPDPKPGSWECFEDKVFETYRRADTPNLRVLTGEGQGGTGPRWPLGGSSPPAPTTLDGGQEEVAAVGRRPPLEASSQAAVGSQPVPVVSVQPGQHPTNFEREEHQ